MKTITGITRVRNESLIIADTIRHFLGYCDHIILYDDCSTDDTVAIANEVGGSRLYVIRGETWEDNRVVEETRHRALLLKYAQSIGAEWCLYFDADERLVGELPPLTKNGYRFRLFDGYLTDRFPVSYAAGRLDALPRMWGPEYRDIMMLFRADKAYFRGKDMREPVVNGKTALAPIMVKHYGKCMSVQDWEDKCNYYATHFPQRYKKRWEARRGKAIHTLSDFNRPLYQWDELMKRQDKWVSIR